MRQKKLRLNRAAHFRALQLLTSGLDIRWIYRLNRAAHFRALQPTRRRLWRRAIAEVSIEQRTSARCNSVAAWGENHHGQSQ